MRIDAGLHAHAGSITDYPNLAEWLDQALFAEQAGFSGVWGAEHHFFWDGWATPTPTNPLMVGAYLAARTSKVRIGQCGLSVNDWHPLRLAEDTALLDHMSGGRMDFGIMRGLNNRVNGNFNPDADRRDQQRANAMMWETLAIVRKAWTGEPFSHAGDFYRIPIPGWVDESTDKLDPAYYAADGELTALSVQPSPVQQPSPPVWLMADSPASHAEAAKRGLNVMSWGRSPRAAREAWDAYDDSLDDGANGQVALMRCIFVADSREEADRIMRPAINELLENMGYSKNPSWGRKGMLASDEDLTDDMLNCDWYDYLTQIRWAIVGTADYVTESLLQLKEEIGLEHVVQYWSVAELTAAQVRRSQELFADKVLPQLVSA
jgi:alkanesulfonate monooxygenase SsuD/methylene tetrahydromethanopterin reductase-like flavin-dependent oxidoreductase (luciferase family)